MPRAAPYKERQAVKPNTLIREFIFPGIWKLAGAAGVAVLAQAGFSAPARADAVADFYSGKSLKMIVSSG